MDDWAKKIRYTQKLRYNLAKRSELSEKALAKIRASRYTKRISYPEMKDAYDYVDKLYPNAHVKNVVALHTHKRIIYDAGYKGVGGFYDTSARVIVVSDYIAPNDSDEFKINAVYTLDEIFCHELIHYGANANCPVSTRTVEEEIAYGKSIGYLRQKGRSDDFIVDKNMMPYLITIVDRELVLSGVIGRKGDNLKGDFFSMPPSQQEREIDALRVELAREMLSQARDIGFRMIASYDNANSPVEDRPITFSPTVKRNLIFDDIDD